MPVYPPKPSYLDGCDFLGALNGERRWRSKDRQRLYTWDSLHGEIEVFNRRGRHLGAADALTRLNAIIGYAIGKEPKGSSVQRIYRRGLEASQNRADRDPWVAAAIKHPAFPQYVLGRAYERAKLRSD